MCLISIEKLDEPITFLACKITTIKFYNFIFLKKKILDVKNQQIVNKN